jgi:hypothetical protein
MQSVSFTSQVFEFNSRPWKDLHNIIFLWKDFSGPCGRSVVFSSYTGFPPTVETDGVVSLLRQLFLRHSLLRPCIPDCIIISYLITAPNNYRIIARRRYWKYDHECRKTDQIKWVCGTCYAHEFNLNAFRHEWLYIQYSRRAIDYYIYFIVRSQ